MSFDVYEGEFHNYAIDNDGWVFIWDVTVRRWHSIGIMPATIRHYCKLVLKNVRIK